MGGKDLKFTVKGDVDVKGLEGLAKAAEKAGVNLDGSQTSAKQLATVLKALADAGKAELEGIESAADSLRAHLGDAAEGMNLQEAVARMRNAGLTFEEIEADAKDLADALKHVDDVNKSIDSTSLRDVADNSAKARSETDELSHSARGANSALANMVGNSAQDLGQLGGLAGSVGVGIGQMAEYAADATLEGEKLGSALASMATVAGPIATLAVTIAAVQGAMEAAAAAEKRSKANVDAWRKAMDSGGDAAAEYANHLRELGQVSLDVQREQSGLQNVTAKLSNTFGFASPGVEVFKNIIGASDDTTKDLTATLTKAGVSVSQWTKLTMSGSQGVEALNAILNEANITGGDHDDIITALTQSQTDYQSAVQASTVFTKFFGEETKNAGDIVTEAFDRANAAVADFQRQVEAERKSIQDNADDLRDNADAVYEMIDARRAAADSRFAVQRANDEWSKSLTDTTAKAAELEKTIKDGSKTDSEKVAAYTELQDLYRKGAESAANFADAEVQLAKDQATAKGETLSHADELDIWNRKMLAAAASTDGPMRDAITGFIADVNGIPPETVADIVARTDPTSVEDTAADLDAVSESRDSLVNAQADTTLAETQIQSLNGTEVTITPTVLASALRQKIANALGPFAAIIGLDGLADGGFTGRGGKHEIAGVVHKGEYVIPAEGVDQSTGTPKGFAAGGFTGTAATSRSNASAPRSSGQSSINLGSALNDVLDGYAALLDATDALTAAQQRLAKAVEEGGRTLDANTEEGRANRDAIDAQWAAVQKLAEAQFKQGASVQDVTAFLRSNVDALREQLASLGLASDAIDDYLIKLGATPAAIDAVTEAINKQQLEAQKKQREEQQKLRDEQLEEQARMEDYLYERQKLSAKQYLEILRQRLAAVKQWSSEYVAILRMIDRVESDLADSEKKTIGLPARSGGLSPPPSPSDGKITIAGVPAVHSVLQVQGSILGVDALHEVLDERDRKLAVAIQSGRRG